MVAVIPLTIAGIISSILGLWGTHSITSNVYNQRVVTSDVVDRYLGKVASWSEKFQCLMLDRYARGTKTIHDDANETSPAYPIFVHEQFGLKRTRNARRNETSNVAPKGTLPPLIIGTIRMGYGHNRIAHAVASFAKDNTEGRAVYFHDIVEIGNEESALIDEAETLYSTGSRTITETPHMIETMLAKITSGGPDATLPLRMQMHAATLMKSLMGNLDRNSPVIATHPLVAAIAVEANFTNVINLVVDNHPQWFVIVPNALNLIQGPKLYRELLKLGPDNLELAGHWNPRCIVDTIQPATAQRMERVSSKKPLRLLIPVGGAGAQESFLVELLENTADLVQSGRVQLFLNAGDHTHMDKAFREKLAELTMPYKVIANEQERETFLQHLQSGQEPSTGITLFAYVCDDLAVTTTDVLVQHSDVLVCKPSEMAFYAIPKLMIRRVGDHERKSAIRAAELGEGTLEARTVSEVRREIDIMLNKPDDLITMNKMIRKNDEIGIYDGAKYAVKRALELAQQS